MPHAVHIEQRQRWISHNIYTLAYSCLFFLPFLFARLCCSRSCAALASCYSAKCVYACSTVYVTIARRSLATDTTTARTHMFCNITTHWHFVIHVFSVSVALNLGPSSSRRIRSDKREQCIYSCIQTFWRFARFFIFLPFVFLSSLSPFQAFCVSVWVFVRQQNKFTVSIALDVVIALASRLTQ